MPKPVAVIIVDYRTPGLVLDCLASLAGQLPPGSRAYVMDNDSGDGSAARVGEGIRERGWSSWARSVPLPRNGGFAYGNNAGIRLAREEMPGLDLLILLNPDTLVRPGSLMALLGFMDRHPSAGIAGPAIVNADGRREASAHAFPSPLGELEGSAKLGPLSRVLRPFAVSPAPGDRPSRCDWVCGACMAVRTEALDRAGLFDEGFFLYFEEVDLCWRIKRAGWDCWTVPEAGIVHLEGASTGIKRRRRRLPAYYFESRRRFLAKTAGRAGWLAADALRALGSGSLALRRGLGLGGRDGQAEEPARQLRDMLSRDLSALLRCEMGRKRLESRY